MRRCLALVPAACLIALAPAALHAQFETASVLGYVRDTSGATVAQATVTLTDQQTKAVVTATTNGQGSYEFTDVKIGQYLVTAQAPGFDLSTTQPFTVTVNARQRVDVSLKIGANNETVTVDSAASILDTDNSERGQVIGRREVENLPLNGREYADLAALVPGVRRDALENQTDSSRDASFNVNGLRSEFNNFLLDGLDNNAYGTSNQGFSNQAIPPSPDAISEFRVETDNYSAEYGRSAGAVINVSILSGTNNFHGKVYDYIRNTVLNAVGPFSAPLNPLTGAPQKPTLIRNQFGGTLGGPLWKDQTFFFADYEGDRQIVHSILQATVPTANQAGTSALAKANGGYTFLAANPTNKAVEGSTLVAIRNPITGQMYNGVVPFTDPTISSFARGVLNALPAPNVTGGVFANNYASLPADTINDDKGDVRADQVFSQKTTAFARYSQHKGAILSPPAIQGPAGGNSNGNVRIFNQQIAGGLTRAFTQNLILDARFAFTRTDGGKFPYGQTLPSLMAGIPGLPTDPTVVRSLNGQNVSGYTQFGNQTSNPQFQDPYVYNPKVNVTLLHGRSSYKAGYEYQAIFTTLEDFNPTYGQSTYAGGFSSTGLTSGQFSAADTGTKDAGYLGDFLFGAQSQYQLNNYQVVHLNQRMHFLYLQDDIRVTPQLTVNAGLRYELVTPQWESNNLLANFSPATNTLIPASPGSLYNRALVNMPKLDLAPRVGFAYSVDPKTVVRAAYGISYAQFNREGGENLLVYNLPNIVNTSINQVPVNANPLIAGSSVLPVCTTAQANATFVPGIQTCFRTTVQGFPAGFTSPSVVTPLSYANTQARYIPANLPTGYVQAFHLTVQREITSSSTFEVSYVGEHGVKLQVLADYNQASANPVTATCSSVVNSGGCVNLLLNNQARPLKTFPTIEETLPAGFLSYNSLQTKFEHRTAHGLYLLNSFTWSRAIDNASGHLDTNAGDNSRINLANPLGDRGVSGYNQPLNETLSLVYDLPYGKGRTFGGNAPRLLQEILGGWQITTIENAQSGAPVNIIYSPTAAQSVSTILNQRPNQLSNAAVLPKPQRTKTSNNQGINTLQFTAFSLPSPNQPYGSAGRNSVRFDPYYDTDLGLHKQFALYPERVVFEFRAEAFNLLNQTNYAFPASETFSPTSTSFGVVTSATTFPARQLQLAGKIIF